MLVPGSGKSIIEEWRNPAKYTENLSQNDRGYEERAVDVVIDNYPQNLAKRTAIPSRIGNNSRINNTEEKLIKIRRPQGGGTVRSIPIKDYQASIVHNIGTLKRISAPQFESLLSGAEKSFVPSNERMPIINSLHQRTASQTTMEATHGRFCRFCNGQHDHCCVNVDSSKDAGDNRYFNQTLEDQESQGGSDIDEYFRKSSRRRFSTSDFRRDSRNMRESSRADSAETAVDARSEQAKALQLTEGHVGQKISAYEQNVRRGDANPVKYRSAFEGLRRHRSIGVPLVGMHNACGLPVVASWHDHELLEPLQISHGIVATVGPICRNSRTASNVKRRTQPKRKAPQPMDRTTITSKDRNVKKSMDQRMKCVTTHLDTPNGRFRKKHFRRSSFAAKGSLSSKNSFKKTARPKRYSGIRASSLMDTLSRRSLKGGIAKRTTLYAKDEGDEAVQVLKSLCLNPLARTNSEADMMW